MSDKPLEITEVQRETVEKVASFIVRFGLTAPALLSLETMRPLAYVGSQFMHLLSPAITAFLTADAWEQLALLLEKRGGLDYLLERIEALDKERRES